MSLMIDRRYSITPNARLRASPFYDATITAGVRSFTVYNQMLMPTDYGDLEGEYWRLKTGVSMWDVAAQRQVQIQGPDAAHLVQILCPRDLSNFQIGQSKYVALCNHACTLINDPVVLKLDEQSFLISISDSNILFWARAIGAERNLKVNIAEPDISPLAIQGPKAEEVVTAMFGDWIRNIRYFRFEQTELNGIPLLVSRSGYSKQGGFELYLLDGSKGSDLWNIVNETGSAWNIRPGAPHQAERVESGLLSFGADNDDTTNPFEVRMDKFVNLNLADDIVGVRSLKRIKTEGVKRHQLGFKMSEYPPIERNRNWIDILLNGVKVGSVTTLVWSWRIQRNIGLAVVDRSVEAGDDVTIQIGSKTVSAELVQLPFD